MLHFLGYTKRLETSRLIFQRCRPYPVSAKADNLMI